MMNEKDLNKIRVERELNKAKLQAYNRKPL